MTGNPIPGLVLPAINAPQIEDTRVAAALQKIQTWGQTVSPRIWTVGTPIYAPNGPAPTPPSDSYLGQVGRQLVTFTAGVGTLTLPRAWPNGWLSLQINGSNAPYYNTSGVTLKAITIDTNAGTTGGVECDYQAIGW